MTGDVAVAVAVAAAGLSLLLLGVAMWHHRAVRLLTRQVEDLRAADQRALERIEALAGQQQDTFRAVELALQTPAATGPAADEHPTADEDVTVITDISDRLRGLDGEDDVTTARIASVTLGGPLIKVAAFSHGVRHALDEEQRMRIAYAVRKELRRQRKMRRRRRTGQAPSKRWG